MRTLLAGLLLAGLAGMPERTLAPARAQVPVVSVAFDLAESTYRGMYSDVPGPAGEPSELAQFERDTGAALQAELSDRVGFVRFTSDPAPLRLTITLRSEPPASPVSDLIPTFLAFELSGMPPAEAPPELVWEFRKPEAFGAPTDKLRFTEEIRRRLEQQLDASLDQLVERLLCRLSLAGEVFVLRGASSSLCVLPFSYDDIRAGVGTAFVCEIERPGDLFAEILTTRLRAERARTLSVPLPAPFSAGIQAVDDPPAPGAPPGHTPLSELLASSDRLQVLRLCVTAYRPVAPVAIDRNRPSDFEGP
jgi:hypothetical protein